MVLADKIMELRKRNGWSQEELAERLGVSRQAVSKWEGATSMPDMDKVVKMSEIFGVSTDYLLKDAAPPVEGEVAPPFETAESPVRTVSLEEVNSYLATVQETAGKIALGVALCILSPVVLLLLLGLMETGGTPVTEKVAVGVGLPLLLLLVAAAVALFLFYGRRLERWSYLEKEEIELAYGVTGVVEKEKAKYEPAHTRALIIGVVLCILSVIPIFIASVLESEPLALLSVDVCLVFVALGVFFIVRTGTIYGGFQRLLEEGDFTREKKLENERNEWFSKVYWCIVTAIYLGWSFVTMRWERTWILWPCAGVLFGAICGIEAAVRKKR